MAIAYVSGGNSSDTTLTGTSITFSPSITVGTCVMVSVVRSGSSAVTGVTDNASPPNTYTLVESYTAGAPYVYIYQCLSLAHACTSLTVNYTAGSYTVACFERYTGVVALGSNSGVNNGSTSPETIAGTMGATTSYMFSAFGHLNTVAGTATNGTRRGGITGTGITVDAIDNTGSLSPTCSATYTGSSIAYAGCYVELSLTAGAANVSITGVAAVSAIHVVTPKVDESGTATGVSATTAIGTISLEVDESATATGVSASTAIGTVTAGVTVSATATGVSATTAIGSVTLEVDESPAATGVTAVTAIGTITVSAASTTTVAGVSAVTALGTVTAGVAVSAAITGVFCTTSIGVPAASGGGAPPYQFYYSYIINSSAVFTSGGGGGGGGMGTTLALETGHNSSADSDYVQSRFSPQMFNGTPGNPNITIDPTKTDDSQNPITPSHISSQKLPLMTPGWTHVPRAVHVVPWWGSGAHPNIGTPNFRNNSYLDAFLNKIFNTHGFDYIIYDWYGQGSYEDGSTLAIGNRATATGFSAYKYLQMIDKGAISGTGVVATNNTIAAIRYLNATYFGDYRYIKIGARPVIMLFGVSQISGINMPAVKAAAATLGNPLIIDEGTSGFAASWCDGCYSWVAPYNPPQGNPINPADPYDLGYLTGFSFQANLYPSKYLWLSAWCGFDGTCTRVTSWSLGKILQRDGGKCWVASWNAAVTQANKLHNPAQLQGFQVPTYDDWQEGSEIESGIQNWATVNVSISGSILTWSAVFGKANVSQTVLGDLTTVFQWKLWSSVDRTNINLVANLPTSTTTFDVSTLSGFTGPVFFYVEAEGMPAVRSHMTATPAVYTF